ncbi:MAG: permease [Gammaproteobacteria bacterium]|nr:permease [Gammaproteobacteria bacterium]
MDPEIILMLCSLLGAGAVAGITTGLFGVGGGFIIVPTLLAILPMFAGDSDGLVHTAIGTSLASIIVSSFRAVQTHRKNNLVDFSVLKAWAPWLLIGVAGGVVLASYMDATALIVVFAVGVLVYSIYFIFPQYFEPKEVPWSLPQGLSLAGFASALGGFSALLGIGGGTPFVVIMVICGRRVHQAVATAAGVGFIIAIPGAIGFLILGLTQKAPLPWGSIGYVHIPALLAISFMTVFTSPWGAKIAQRLNEVHLKRAFGIYLIAVAISMLSKLA